MFKRIKKLFSSEERLSNAFGQELGKIVHKIEVNDDDLRKKLHEVQAGISHINSKMNERMSKIEVLFADEMAEKERQRDAKVKAARKDA